MTDRTIEVEKRVELWHLLHQRHTGRVNPHCCWCQLASLEFECPT